MMETRKKTITYFVFWGLMVVCMVPYYLAFFPGVFGYDTPIQMMMYYGEIPLSTHHPLVHTYLVGAFLSLGELLFNSRVAGFKLFIILQWALASNALATGFYKLYLKKLKLPLLILPVAWSVVLCPALMILSFNSTKDTLFGIFFLYFFLALWDFFDMEKDKKPLSVYLRIFIFALLICLFRNQGIYIILAFAVILLIMRIKPAKLILPLIASVILSFSFSIVSVEFLGVEKGDSKEMFSVPLMQIAYTLNEYREGRDVTVSDEDVALIYELFSEDAFLNADGNWDGADYFKAYFNTTVFKANLGKYAGLYFRLGIHNINEYFTEFHNLVSPYFCMGKCKYRGLMFDSAFEETSGIQIPVDSKFNLFRKATHFYVTRVNNYFLILEPGIGLYILAFGFIYGCVKKKKNAVALFLPHILYFMTCLLGPIALLRYLYPIMMVTPVAIGYLITNIGEK